ncbi:MAG: hypothetical protein ACQESO_03155 [Bacillota bacterium]
MPVMHYKMEKIVIGEESTIQDNVAVHVDEGVPTHIGSRVKVGHNCILPGCTVEDRSLIGIGSIILNNAVTGKNRLVAAALFGIGIESLIAYKSARDIYIGMLNRL